MGRLLLHTVQHDVKLHRIAVSAHIITEKLKGRKTEKRIQTELKVYTL